MGYPVDNTQDKINPSGYSNINPFWADVGGEGGVNLPAGRQGQVLSLKNTVVNSPSTQDLVWRDEKEPDLSSYYTKEEIDAKETVQNQTIEVIRTESENSSQEIDALKSSLTLKASVAYVNEQTQLLTQSTDTKLAQKADKQATESALEAKASVAYVDEKVASIPGADLSNYYDKTETNALLQTKADKAAIDNLESQFATFETKQEHQESLTTLNQTIDAELATLDADIIPSRAILSESMKEGNSQKVYGFKRGSGTESDPYNQAIELTEADLSSYYTKVESDERFQPKGQSPSLPSDISYSINYTLNNTFFNANYIPLYITNFILHIAAQETREGAPTISDTFSVYMTREATGNFKGTYTEVDVNHGTHIYSFDCSYTKMTDESYTLTIVTKVQMFNNSGKFGNIQILDAAVMSINIGTQSVDAYTKEEVDAKLTPINTQLETLNTNETAIYEELNQKANLNDVVSKSYLELNYYTQSQTKSTFYTKSQIDSKLSSLGYGLEVNYNFANDWFDRSSLVANSAYLVDFSEVNDASNHNNFFILARSFIQGDSVNLAGYQTSRNSYYYINLGASVIQKWTLGYTGQSTNSKNNPIKAIYKVNWELACKQTGWGV